MKNNIEEIANQYGKTKSAQCCYAILVTTFREKCKQKNL